MAVERPAGYNPAPSDPMSDAPEIEVEAAIGEEVIENPDGSVTFGEEAVVEEQVPFGANLAELLDDNILNSISEELRS